MRARLHVRASVTLKIQSALRLCRAALLRSLSHFTLHSSRCFVYVGSACDFCVNISRSTLMFFDDDLNEFGYEIENNHALI